jgi:hypothetical protein
MDPIDSKLFSEIITKQIAFQEMEIAHDQLLRTATNPDIIRKSKQQLRKAESELKN